MCVCFVLVPTEIVVSPSKHIELNEEAIEIGEVFFPCEAKSDDSTPTTITW